MLQQSNLCTECGLRPIYVKVRKLCLNCYQKAKNSPDWNPRALGGTKQSRGLKLARYYTKYGPEFLGDIKSLTQIGPTLRSVAVKYGLTYERIRQLFQEITGRKYTEVVKEKSARIKAEVGSIGCKYDPRQAVEFRSYTVVGCDRLSGKVAILEKAQSMGCKITPIPGKSEFDINGHRVWVSIKQQSSAAYYHVGVRKDLSGIDFILAYLAHDGTTYIIPKSAVGDVRDINIRAKPTVKPTRNSIEKKLEQYKEAWHLLARAS